MKKKVVRIPSDVGALRLAEVDRCLGADLNCLCSTSCLPTVCTRNNKILSPLMLMQYKKYINLLFKKKINDIMYKICKIKFYRELIFVARSVLLTRRHSKSYLAP